MRACHAGAAIGVALGLMLAGLQTAWAGRAPQAGEPAPPLVAKLFDGRSLDIADLQGQVVILNLWASWCAPCRKEMPVLDALAQEYASRGVTVVGLSADDAHDRRDAERIARAHHYALGMLSEAPHNGFGMPAALPLTYVIDRSGRVASVLSAASEGIEDRLRAAIDSALAAKEDEARRNL